MQHKGKRARVFNESGTESVPALLIPVEDYVLVVEGHPNDYGRQLPLNGRSRIYLLGNLKTEEIDEFEIDVDVMRQAREYVHALHTFQMLASPGGLLADL